MDIVERLRERKASLYYTDSTMRTHEVVRPLPIEIEAADEIERLRSDLALLGPVTAGVNVSQCRRCYAECADEWKHCPQCGAQERFPDKMVHHRKQE
jgi:ribosomal protein L40E